MCETVFFAECYEVIERKVMIVQLPCPTNQISCKEEKLEPNLRYCERYWFVLFFRAKRSVKRISTSTNVNKNINQTTILKS